MQRRHAMFLLLAAAGAALALWLLAAGESPAPAVAPDEPSAVAAPVAPVVPAPASAAADGPHVAVAVALREAFAPPPTARVHAVEVAAADAPLPLRVVAGVGAGCDPDDGAAGGSLVAIAVAGGELLRHASLPARGTASVRLGGVRVVRGRVLGLDGAPARGASVWFGETTSAGRREFVVDDEGRYEASTPAGDGVPFVVRAPGCAAHARAIDVGDGAIADARLEPACVLEVQLAAVAAQLDHVRVYVLPTAELAASLANWPFHAQALTGGYAVDGSGRAQIDDLPRDVEVGVVVAHPLVARMAPQVVRTKGERARAVVALPAYAARTLAGVVVDDDGAPVAGAMVRLAPGGAAAWPRAPRLAPAEATWRGVFAVTADAVGAFVLGVPDDDAPAVVQVRAPGHAGRVVLLTEWPATGRIALPRWRGGEPGFALAPPQAGVAWTAAADLAGGIRAALAADEPWRVSLPQAGRYDFTLTTTPVDGPSHRCERRDVVATGPVELAVDAAAGR
jgi:hypothetical protein